MYLGWRLYPLLLVPLTKAMGASSSLLDCELLLPRAECQDHVTMAKHMDYGVPRAKHERFCAAGSET